MVMIITTTTITVLSWFSPKHGKNTCWKHHVCTNFIHFAQIAKIEQTIHNLKKQERGRDHSKCYECAANEQRGQRKAMRGENKRKYK